MKKANCYYTDLLKVHEAITLIILSLIYPEPIENKPTIIGLKGYGKQWSNEIKMNYANPLNYNNLEAVLFAVIFLFIFI